MHIVFPSASIRMEVLKRLSLASVERQTSQSHVMMGMPCDVPLPNIVIFIKNSILIIANIQQILLKKTMMFHIKNVYLQVNILENVKVDSPFF